MIVRVIVFSGKVVPKKDVVEVIQRFNIQVNNLTQVSSSTIYLQSRIMTVYVATYFFFE